MEPPDTVSALNNMLVIYLGQFQRRNEAVSPG